MAPIPPDRTHRAADRQLVPLAAAAVAGFCAAVWADDRGLVRVPVFFGCGLAGLLAARLVHRYRCLGLVPLYATVATLVALVGLALGDWPGWAVGLFPLAVGLAAGGVLRYRDTVREEFGRFRLRAGVALAAGLGLAGGFVAGGGEPPARAAFRWLAVLAPGAAAAVDWPTLFRPFAEHLITFLTRALYRPRAVGPGLTAFPATGPVLVIANHADYFDPPLVIGHLPRRVTPLMAAGFYDKPGCRWLMRVFGTIRVPDQAVRRDTPEIDAAVQALAAGRVVMLFPEGFLRRKEEVPLRRFGQGVWKILDARPTTPVVACWVEGTWGSFFSFRGGPPTRNKRLHLRRPVTVGVSAPVVVPAGVLKNRMGTRLYLMQAVADARAHVGLPPLPPVDQLPRDGGGDGEADA